LKLFNRKRKETQQRSAKGNVGVWLQGGDICCPGYTSLDKCPEIITACSKIAQILSTMTIHLRANSEKGDIRIVNELSRKIDINPTAYMTRKTWIEAIVMNMLLYGKGNSIVLPHTSKGLIDDLEIVAPYRVTLQQVANNSNDYRVTIDGKVYNPDEVLHFTYNPNQYYPWKGQGFTLYLRDIAQNLAQATATEKAFMSSEFKPSVIVKVDALTEEFASPEGRENLLKDYIVSSKAGEPWMIPAEQFEVQQVKPLTLADLAINDTVKIDKATVASVLGVPAFLLGVGAFNQQEWSMFVQTTIQAIAQEIQQELTKKLIISSKMYFKFNAWSLMNWNLKEISDVMLAGADRGFISGNDWRDKCGLEPNDALNELIVLENYIPVSMSGAQKKLVQSEGDE
jgi:HK97 family phage portal protein